MIGTVTKVAGNTLMVSCPRQFPGQVLPCLATIHRVARDPDTFTTYRVGDRVVVVEDDVNEFRVAGLAGTPK